MEEIAIRWFSVYYLTLGVLLLTGGTYMIARRRAVTTYILGAATLEKPPAIWIQTVRYLLYFTIPTLVLSFTPFSLPEFLFSIWCLIIIFTVSHLLVYWHQTSKIIRENSDQVSRKITFTAANMLSLGLIMFLLCYHLQSRVA